MLRGEPFTVAVGGEPVSVRRAGGGPRLVYLHDEFAQSAAPLLDQLAHDLDVIAPDLPGFGATPRPGWVETFDDAAWFLADLLEVVGGGEPVDVAGAGLGAWLALEAVVRSPHAASRLVLIGGSGLEVPEHPPADYFVMTPEERRRAMVEDPERYPSLDEALRIRGEIMTGRLAWQPRYVSPGLAHRLHRVWMPVLVIWGARDRFLAPEHATALTHALPNARVELVEGCGHLPGCEKPAGTAALIRSFLAGSRVEVPL